MAHATADSLQVQSDMHSYLVLKQQTAFYRFPVFIFMDKIIVDYFIRLRMEISKLENVKTEVVQ